MKVYLLVSQVHDHLADDFESERIIGIFSNKEKAEEMLEEKLSELKEQRVRFDSWAIELGYTPGFLEARVGDAIDYRMYADRTDDKTGLEIVEEDTSYILTITEHEVIGS